MWTACFFILQGLESEKPAHQFKDVTWASLKGRTGGLRDIF